MSKLKNDFEKLSIVLKALVHPIRLNIVSNLCQNESNVKGLVKALNICQPLTSQHLKKLKRAGVVLMERREQENFYRIANESIKNLVINLFVFVKLI